MKRKVLLVAVLIISMLLQCLMPLTSAFAATSNGVVITLSSTLYSAVKAQLTEQKITAMYTDATHKITISSDELAKVTDLQLKYSGIDDLTGIGSFSSLQTLNLTGNELTVDSNLSEITKLANLSNLNLSTNKISSVSSISNFYSIANTDVTNQDVTTRTIINVDENSNQTTASITLPDILLSDTGRIDASWISQTITPVGDVAPTINWTTLYYGGATVTATVGGVSGTDYTMYKALIKIDVNVNDAKSKLNGTKVTAYYVIVDSTETGIAFEDERLYSAIKTQLTNGQTVNEELSEYTGKWTVSDDGVITKVADGESLYKRAYDVPEIMVIDTNTLINKISSLELVKDRIEDLKGLEEFIGLETNLNISKNYIDSIDRILELEENKETKETELQTRYSTMLVQLTTDKTELQKYEDEVKKIQQEMDSVKDEIAKLDEKATDYDTKYQALNKSYQEKSETKANAENNLSIYTEKVNNDLLKLYTIYQREYKLTTLLPSEVNNMSLSDIYACSSREQAQNWAKAVMDRICALEKASALTTEEKTAITTLFGISTTVTVTDAAGKESTKDIENPISTYFEAQTVVGETGWTIGEAEDFIIKLKYIDTVSQIMNYCTLKRQALGTTECVRTEAIKIMYKEYEAKNLDTSIIEGIEKKINGTTFSTGDKSLDSVLEKMIASECSGSISTDKEKVLAAKLSYASSEVSEYVTLPRIQKLVLEDNEITSLAGIETLEELKTLDVYYNALGDISNVDWSVFTQLKELNLGYNQLSTVKPIEGLKTLESINASHNLISGNFDFLLLDMENLKYLDFSYNQISNLDASSANGLIAQVKWLAKAYNSGAGIDYRDYLTKDDTITVEIGYQTLTFSTTVEKTDDTLMLSVAELSPILAQYDELDDETTYGLTSGSGTFLTKTNAVVLPTSNIGKYQAEVTVQNGLGFGTVCVIDYSVIAPTATQTPVTPDNGTQTPVTPDEGTENPVVPDEGTENPVVPDEGTENPTEPDEEEKTTTPEYGYEVSGEYGEVRLYNPGETLGDFTEKLVSDGYNVVVRDSDNNVITDSNAKMATGWTASVVDDSNEPVTVLEVVVKGDVNGDGEVNSFDSAIIRSIIIGTKALDGAYASAADVNNDNAIDTLDSILVLRYRAEWISSFKQQ